MTATYETSNPSTCGPIPSVTSLRASADGRSLLGERVLQIMQQFGRDRVLASLSARQASAVGLLTSGTCGPASTTSSRSAALQSSLESKLRALLTGSDLCEVTWKPWNTPWGQCLSRPRARVQIISETASGLWPTSSTVDATGRGYHNSRGTIYPALPGLAGESQIGPITNGSSERTEKPGALNPEFVCWLMGFPPAWVSCGVSAMQSIQGRRRRS